MLPGNLSGILFKTASAILFAASLVLTGTGSSMADLGSAARTIPSPELVGKGRLTFLGFKVFDAELYAPQGQYSPNKPFALKLTYLRNFKGTDISKKSAEEMIKQGASQTQVAKWSAQMSAIFPNVSKGQSITGVRTANGGTVFYKNNRKIGSINDVAFSQRFFNIWLGNRTSNPQLRAKLTGAKS